MPLEFPCPNCQHLLRTADDKAGLSATCPACGESLWVPYPHQIAGPSELDDSGDRYELDGDDSFAPEGAAPTAPDDPFADDAPAEAGSYALARPEDEPPPAAPRANVCGHCGTENEPDARECRACAAELQPPPPPQTAKQPGGWQPRDPDLGEILESSWKIFVEEIGLLIGAMLLMFVLGVGVGIVCMIPALIGAAIAAAIDGDLVPAGYFAGVLITLPFSIAFGAALQIGYVQLHLNVVRGKPAGIGDLFYGFREGRAQIIPMFLLGILSGLFALCTCLLGSIVVWPLNFLIVHRRTDTGDGLNLAIEFLQKEFVTILLVGLILAGIYFAISVLNMCFYLGLVLMIFVAPFLMTLMAVGYLRMERERIAVDRD